MRKAVRALGIATVLAVMIPLSAYASTNAEVDLAKSDGPGWSSKSGIVDGREGIVRRHGFVSQEVLDLLKLDQAAFNAKVESGKTLAQIAQEQGVSRESLKKTMMAAFNKKMDARKKSFAEHLDKFIDADLKAMKGRMGFHVKLDFAEAAKIIGITAEQMKQGLSEGKSLADLAKEKGVDAKKLIDAQVKTMSAGIKQAVKDGRLTQAEADRRLAEVGAEAEEIVNHKGFGRMHRHWGGKDRAFGGDRGFDGEKPTFLDE